MGQPKKPKVCTRNVELWEWELIQASARRIRTTERDELEAELARHLLRLKCNPPGRIRNWKTFLKTALRHKASNWIRDQQARQKSLTSLQASSDEDLASLIEVLQSSEADADLRSALARLWEELDPELKRTWELLDAEGGNQVQVAKRLGKHRNTVSAMIRKIQQIVIAHGLAASSRGQFGVTAQRSRPAHHDPASGRMRSSSRCDSYMRSRCSALTERSGALCSGSSSIQPGESRQRYRSVGL